MAQCLEYNKNRLKCPKWHCHCAGTSLYRSGKYYGKQRLNKWVLRRLLKTSNEGADLTCCGRLIQWTRTERHRVLLQLLRKLFSNITGNDTNVLLSNEASIENFRKKTLSKLISCSHNCHLSKIVSEFKFNFSFLGFYGIHSKTLL